MLTYMYMCKVPVLIPNELLAFCHRSLHRREVSVLFPCGSILLFNCWTRMTIRSQHEIFLSSEKKKIDLWWSSTYAAAVVSSSIQTVGIQFKLIKFVSFIVNAVSAANLNFCGCVSNEIVWYHSSCTLWYSDECMMTACQDAASFGRHDPVRKC
jgi:hypothetical protein